MTRNHVNLLPKSYLLRRLARRRLRQWSLVWLAVVAGLAVVWLDERSRWAAALEELESSEQRYDEVRLLKGEIGRLTAQKQGLGKQQALVVRLQQAPHPLLLLALVSQSAARCEGRVAAQHLVYAEDVVAPQPVAAPQTPRTAAQAAATSDSRPLRSGQLIVDGIGADNIAIAEFVLGLRESGAFDRVDLKSAAASATPAGAVTSYRVECGL